MGGGVTAHLAANGCDVTCYDPDPEICSKMVDLGAKTCTSPSALAKKADVIILSLPKAEIVESVIRDIQSDIAPAGIVLDTSTSEPVTSQAMSALGEKRGFFFVDGPVSGGPAAAKSGTMTMLLGGEANAIERLRPVLDILTAKTVVVGGSGAGHAAKIANNMLCAANLVLVGEAVKLGQAAGVAPEDLLEGINAGSGRSGVSEVNFPKWILNDSFDSGFTMGLMRKDVGLALDLAKSKGVSLDGFAPIAELWRASIDQVPDQADFNEIVNYDRKRD